jgi:hypothetical protein
MFESRVFGGARPDFVRAGVVSIGPYFCIEALSGGCTIGAIAWAGEGDDFTGASLVGGQRLYSGQLEIDSIRLDAGEAIAYRVS